MEYSKEDLMEAKKQIWGVGENMGTEESKKIWEENAQFWDNAMGDESNEFHREVVRPKVTELLSPNPARLHFGYCVWQWKLFFVSCTKRRFGCRF